MVVYELLEAGVDIEARSFGATALHQVAKKGHHDIAGILLENGADINANDGDRYTALQLAVNHGHEGVVQVVLTKGANTEARTINGFTVLDMAIERGGSPISVYDIASFLPID
jgi:ankyrin repeat protein